MQNNNPNNYDLALGFLQVFDVLLNVNQVSNDVILKELQHQNTDYLDLFLRELKDITSYLAQIYNQNNTILTQNERILELLKNKTTD